MGLFPPVRVIPSESAQATARSPHASAGGACRPRPPVQRAQLACQPGSPKWTIASSLSYSRTDSVTPHSPRSQHVTLAAFATLTPLTLHVPRDCRWGLPSSETPLPAMILLPVSALGSVLTSGATRAARCAPRSAGTESLSSGFRQAAGRSIGHAE